MGAARGSLNTIPRLKIYYNDPRLFQPVLDYWDYFTHDFIADALSLIANYDLRLL